jgi:ribose 5-phosphate isomerase B
MKIYIGSDHAGYVFKKQLLNMYTCEDCGCFSNNSVDYPDIAKTVCTKINHDIDNNVKSIGILICGTGIGMSIAANKYDNIRCALVYNNECASLTRKHNDANVLALGARMTTFDNIKSIIDIFINTEFEGGRHQNRINKL